MFGWSAYSKTTYSEGVNRGGKPSGLSPTGVHIRRDEGVVVTGLPLYLPPPARPTPPQAAGGEQHEEGGGEE